MAQNNVFWAFHPIPLHDIMTWLAALAVVPKKGGCGGGGHQVK
jgi:hypothetical protein